MKIELCDDLFCEEELANTPDRYKRFLDEWANKKEFKFTMFDNPNYDQMIICKDIDFASLCSHHLLPFTGKAHIGYIPKGKICGLSKLARAVDKFASKPQIQERMTQEIADFLDEKLKPAGVIVVIEAGHQCMRIRGVKKAESVMVTSALKGVFKTDNKPREEFLRLIKNG